MVKRIPYKQTGFFSRIVTDYVAGEKGLSELYQYSVDEKGLQAAQAARRAFSESREKLVKALEIQYESLHVHSMVKDNVAFLKEENTYSITTAHQPNIFTGPLYFIYKILQVIKISQVLNEKFPQHRYVPVYYMGSEDADIDELNHITIQNKGYSWSTKQTGAVGRMMVDQELLDLIEEIEAQIGIKPFGIEWCAKLKSAYKKGTSIQQATLHLINELFGRFGLVVLIPDSALLKEGFNPIIEKELSEQFSKKEVEIASRKLADKNYKVQTEGRDINLFYLKDDIRERIIFSEDKYHVLNTQLYFTHKEILEELHAHPERFSGNVILRGPYQETILPNVAFVGGGGEIAYWLELKNVFEKADVPYPMLVLRNSYLLLNERQQDRLQKVGISASDLFINTTTLLDNINCDRKKNISINEEIAPLDKIYDSISKKAAEADSTLIQHVSALHANTINRLQILQKKIDRAQRHKLETETKQITALKDQLFPYGSLQERVENIAYYYALHGDKIFDVLLENALSFEQEFTILELKNNLD